MAQIRTQSELNDQLVQSINWTQESGEFSAVSYLAFNLAKEAFDRALANGIQNPSVSVDLDETYIDNSAYQAGLVDSNNQFSNSTWYPWIRSELATIIPGAVEFNNYVNSKGGKVFFISDRDESSTNNSNNNDLEQATINNLNQLGFTGVSDETVLLRGEFTGIVNDRVNFSKEFRRDAVENGSADGTERPFVVLVGDNLNDLDDKAGTSNSDRRAYVDASSDRYGIYEPGKPAYIALPNPQYGAWETALYNPAEFGKTQVSELTPAEKNQQRKATFSVWNAPAEVNARVTSGGGQDRLNEQLVLPINWIQESGEFAATAYLAYNAAKIAFDEAKASGVVNPSVVLDLDETVLDNSAYEAWLVDKNEQFSNSTWYQWLLSREATATPGAIEFINYVNANGGKAYFISDRDESSTNNTVNNDLELATLDNMVNLGITGVSDETLLLRGEFTGTVDGRVNFSKEFRRQAVENGSIDGIDRTTVVLIGDNLNDFDANAGNRNSDRRAYVDSISGRYGIYEPGTPAYIPLSNPMYGSWESAIYDPTVFGKTQVSELTPEEKSLQRKQALTRWVSGRTETFTNSPATLASDTLLGNAEGAILAGDVSDELLMGNSVNEPDLTPVDSDFLVTTTYSSLTSEALPIFDRGLINELFDSNELGGLALDRPSELFASTNSDLFAT